MKPMQRIAVAALGLILTVCGLAQAADNLQEVLAGVNNKPIYKKDVLPHLDTTRLIAARLERPIDRELIGQQIITEKLDEDPRYQAVIARRSENAPQIAALRQRELAILNRLYEDTIPDFVTVLPILYGRTSQPLHRAIPVAWPM